MVSSTPVDVKVISCEQEPGGLKLFEEDSQFDSNIPLLYEEIGDPVEVHIPQ